MKQVLQEFVRFGKELLSLKSQVEKNTHKIKEIRQDLQDLAKAVQELSYNIQRNQENNVHEREKLELKLENCLLRFFRNIPTTADEDVRLRSQNDGRKLPPDL